MIHNDKVLVVRNIASNNYCSPGGKLEGSESVYECLECELYEELGIKGIPDTVIALQELSDRELQYRSFEYFITLKNADEYYNNTALNIDKKEIQEVLWIDINALNTIKILPSFMVETVKDTSTGLALHINNFN